MDLLIEILPLIFIVILIALAARYVNDEEAQIALYQIAVNKLVKEEGCPLENHPMIRDCFHMGMAERVTAKLILHDWDGNQTIP